MLAQGVLLQLLLGPTLPLPAPAWLVELLVRARVVHEDDSRSGFELEFQAGRAGLSDVLDYRLLRGRLLTPGSRCLLIVVINGRPEVLMDGLVTHQQLSPGTEATPGTLTVMGQDMGVAMAQKEVAVQHPGLSDPLIVTKILLPYVRYGLLPKVLPPPGAGVPLPTHRIPTQIGTDLEYVQALAKKYGFVFYVAPGPLPGTSEAYFGPRIRPGLPQSALSVNLGSATNVNSIHFSFDALEPEVVSGKLQDADTGLALPVRTFTGLRLPLSRSRGGALERQVLPRRRGGIGFPQALALAQGRTDASQERTITAEGELDSLRYGRILQSRRLVDVRGVGDSYSGTYYVKRVTHELEEGSYRQRFMLARHGLGGLLPLVRP